MRSIVHLDADAFFASVEQAADLRLRGRPVAVGGEKRGIIASASYEARRYGIYTPMPTVRARKLCPKLIVLPGDFDKYERFSRWMFSYAYDFTPEVEIGSIDEGYFDLTGARKPAVTVAETIRNAIRQALKITVSEGIGSSKLVSQIASKLNKPAAFFHVPPGRERQFLDPLPNGWLPGVGPQTATRLNTAGLAYIHQIAATPADLLSVIVGGLAVPLQRFANGIDDRPVVPASAPAKSYGQQETFARDQTDEEFIEATLRRMAEELMTKVRQDGKAIRTLTVKVRYNDLDEKQASESLHEPTDIEADLDSRLRPLLHRAWERRVSLRMVSLKVSNVYDGFCRTELPLEAGARQHAARRRLAAAVDELRRTHGRNVILRGHDWVLRKPPDPDPEPAAAATVPAAGGRTADRTAARTVYPGPVQLRRSSRARFVPLTMRSHYSFLNSTLSPQAIVDLACRHDLPAIALCDQGNLHGAVEFVQAARAAGIQPILGAEVQWGGRPLRLYVENARGYANLCRWLSRPAQPEAPRAAGGRRASIALLGKAATGLPGHWHPPDPAWCDGLVAVSPDPRLAAVFPHRFYRAVDTPEEARRVDGSGPAAVAAFPVHYAAPADRWKFDIVQSIRTLTLLRQPHPEKDVASPLQFRPPSQMGEAWSDHPDGLARTREIAERCAFELPLNRLQFPAFTPPDGSAPREFLRGLVVAGLRRRYGSSADQRRAQVEQELSIIAAVGYEEYFLVVWDLLQACRQRGINWITRGSAADSLVCYCLGISDVCPVRFGLYFRRFLNQERMALNKLPDIDVDFPHDRKDDVIDMIFAKYGVEHCAVVGGFSTFKARSAFAEVAKVLGVAEREVRRFTEHFPWSFGGTPAAAPIGPGNWHLNDAPAPPEGRLLATLQARPECRDLPLGEDPFRSALAMAEFLDGVPRYPKMHPCGVVLARQPMLDLTPTFIAQKGYPATHFDMDAVEAIGLVKMDILAQGGLAVMRETAALLARRGVTVDLERCTATVTPAASSNGSPHAAPVPAAAGWSDPEVWSLIAGGSARAVHHIESPAMTSLCRMCNVRDIDTLIAIVSVIRPGAANEDRKREFARRCQGLAPVSYPHPSLEDCLRDSFGLLIYEEQLLQVCEAFAGLPAGRADVLRRALGKEKLAVVAEVAKEFISCARKRGRTEAEIARVWQLVSGFLGYTFCKAHSTAYGVEAYQSAWLKRHFPAEFMAAVLTHGKGFYRPLIYVLECHRLGITLAPPRVNQPGPGFCVQYTGQSGGRGPAASLHVPVSQVKGLTRDTHQRLLAEHARAPFESLADFCRRVRPSSDEMEALIRVGALDGFGRSRATQYWDYRFLRQTWGDGASPDQGWLLPAVAVERLPEVPLSEPSRRQRLDWEEELLGFTASGHPLERFDHVAWDTYCPVARLGEFIGREVVTCGLVVEDRVHHQVTGEPMKFLTLADWTGMIETELFAQTYRSYGLATVRHPVLEVTGCVEPFENGCGFTLRVIRAGKPRDASATRRPSKPGQTSPGTSP